MQQKDNIENKIPSVICDIRQNLGLSPDDPGMDDAITKMSRKELFCRFMTWNGIMGFESFIKCALSEIYNVEFEEGPLNFEDPAIGIKRAAIINAAQKFEELICTESKRLTPESVPVVYCYRVAQIADELKKECKKEGD